jgi:plastocyanin
MRRGRRLLAIASLVGAALPVAGMARGALPTPEPNFATTLVPSPCKAEAGNQYEEKQYADEGWSAADGYTRYGTDCQRLHFAFGPIQVKPGQNDVLLAPVTIEKPAYDGYMVRMRPDLVDAQGNVPPIEQVHLHHGTWIQLLPSPNGMGEYGSGPFFASGEEKTIGDIPRGYGMPIRADDQWQLLYMVHNATSRPFEVYITYDIDFVPDAAVARQDIKPAYPVWLDVGASDSSKSGYPVFNVQKKFGGDDGTCTWPKEYCADVDPWGGKTKNNGTPVQTAGTPKTFPAAGSSLGRIPNFQGGTLVGIGGHLHPGGVSVEVDQVRGDQSTRVFTSTAEYWDRTDNTKVGGPPTSWDLSMTVTGLPRWGLRVMPGDKLIMNATYDTTHQSTYENMGIAVTYIAPDNPDGTPTATGIDAFSAPHNATAVDNAQCMPAGVLCELGVVTHGHMAEAGNFGGPDNSTSLAAMRGSATERVDIGGFLYTPGDFSTIDTTGVPTVTPGQTLTFYNEDTAIDVYHTVTSCGYPCKGATGTSFPLANESRVDFDSAELGYGPPIFGPASNKLSWGLQIGDDFEPGQRYTYYCRIHPFMRGAFEVVPSTVG